MKRAIEDDGVDTERLDDYVRGVGEEDQAQAYEEDLFARAVLGAAPELTFRASLANTLVQMNARGSLDIWCTTRQVEELCAAGRVKAVVFDFNPEQPAMPDIPPGTELLITRIPLDLTGVRALDAEVLSLDGHLLKRMPDINFNPEDGCVYACCEAELARLADTQQTITRVWVTDDGGRRVLMELAGF